MEILREWATNLKQWAQSMDAGPMQSIASGIADFFDFLLHIGTDKSLSLEERQHNRSIIAQQLPATEKAARQWAAYQRATPNTDITHISPVDDDSVVTSPFGPRKAFRTANGTMSSSNHKGIDLAARGKTPNPDIVATADGIILWAGAFSGYGNTVIVGHADGSQTLYAHLASIDPDVSPGAPVLQNHVIGTMGGTGNSTGVHLHYEQRKSGHAYNPIIAGSTWLKDIALKDIAPEGIRYEPQHQNLAVTMPHIAGKMGQQSPAQLG
jgi:murein DD-endopeptidase MepM/ murein hydrolase activator NlpD